MQNNRFNKRRVSVYGLIFLLAFVGILLVVCQIDPIKSIAQLRPKREDVKEVKFFNKTRSFEVASYKVSGEDMEVTFKNNYDKSINGFCVIVGTREEGSFAYVELIYSDFLTEILPGETFTYRTGVDEKLYIEGLTVSAVLFTDRTGDGDPELIAEGQDKREGERFQLSKGLELLKATMDSSPADYVSGLENLKKDISSFETDNKTKSNAYNYGLQTGRGTLMRYIERLGIERSTDGTVAKQKLSELQSKLEKFILKL